MNLLRHEARPRSPVRGGAMTLIELLVVIAILAALATIAIRSSTNLAQSARYDSTQATFNTFRDALLGRVNAKQVDGTILINGFISDVGRPPIASAVSYDGVTTELTVNELLTQPSSTWPTYQARALTPGNCTPPSDVFTNYDASYSYACGWRGPYMFSSAGSSTLTDGWGKRITTQLPLLSATNPNRLLTQVSGTLAAEVTNATLYYVSSAGTSVQGMMVKGGATAGDVVTADDAYYYSYSYSCVFSNEFLASPLTVTVAPQASWIQATNRIIVRVFGPNPAMSDTVAPILIISGTNNTVAASTVVTISDARILQGPKVVRVYAQNKSTSGYLGFQSKNLIFGPGANTVSMTVP